MNRSNSVTSTITNSTRALEELLVAVWGKELLNQATLRDQFQIQPNEALYDCLLKYKNQLTEPESIDRELVRYLEESNTAILGARFESLWTFYCQHLLHSLKSYNNVQVISNKVTLGEYDLLIEQPEYNNHFWHIELATKFYLRDPNQSGEKTKHWIGPQCRDRLDLKVDKTIEKQLSLGESSAGLNKLRELGIESVSPLTIMKGWLFHPFGGRQALPPIINPDCNQGHWIQFNRLRDVANSDSKWQVIDKHQWLTPDKWVFPCQPIMTTEELTTFCRDHFSKKQFCLMVREFTPIAENHAPNHPSLHTPIQSENDKVLDYELKLAFNDRWMITPANWPY